jgi:peroxiredoxin
VNVVDTKDASLSLMRSKGVTYPMILDYSPAAEKTYKEDYQLPGVEGSPLEYVIDREGKIAAAWYGGADKPGLDALEKMGIK